MFYPDIPDDYLSRPSAKYSQTRYLQHCYNIPISWRPQLGFGVITWLCIQLLIWWWLCYKYLIFIVWQFLACMFSGTTENILESYGLNIHHLVHFLFSERDLPIQNKYLNISWIKLFYWKNHTFYFKINKSFISNPMLNICSWFS